MSTVDTSAKRYVVGRGVVRSLGFQVEPSTQMSVCRFQVERKNAQGKPLLTVPVEMRSYSYSGTLANDDWVEITETWAPGEVIHPKQVLNVTTKAPFKSTLGVANSFKAYPRLALVGAAFGGLIFLAVVAVFIVVLVNLHNFGPIFGVGTLNPTLQLSSTSGSPGASLTASGTGWESAEGVDFYYGPELVGTVRTDKSGAFVGAVITIPPDANGFFRSIRATGQSSVHTVEQPFNVVR